MTGKDPRSIHVPPHHGPPGPPDHHSAGPVPPPGGGLALMSARLWSAGVFLVAIGIAAHVVGWDALLWIPRVVMDALAWVPLAVMDAIHTSPLTAGVIALGVVLMVAARIIGRRRG
jgi:hypothetical protein